MPLTPHVEQHFTGSLVVRDTVIGMSDGLTVPFALAAGLSGAVDAAAIIVTAGLAEIAAGSIAMGLGGYLAARGDAEHYVSEKQREEREIVERTHDEEEEIYEIFEQYSVPRSSAAPVLESLKQNPDALVLSGGSAIIAPDGKVIAGPVFENAVVTTNPGPAPSNMTLPATNLLLTPPAAAGTNPPPASPLK